ncbi:hypothetical protein NDU88_005918 [Pleurodeles waltl]|uniref:Uncharacterized protein n=1 Tax=Pleurodeles waltl TaxID=8319 RepID=A0AAV7MIC1_PLEWA|nr:hypothetical protein NDU88_005918 [Pleurodeles waltl]
MGSNNATTPVTTSESPFTAAGNSSGMKAGARVPARQSPAAGSPPAAARTITANPPGPGSRCAAPAPPESTPPLRAVSPRGQAARRSTAGRPDYLTPASPDKKGGPSESGIASRTSRTSAQMHGRVRVARSTPRSSPPQSLRPTGGPGSKARADVPSVTHRAAASAEEPLTSGLERRSPGRHLGFIGPVAAGVYGTDLPLFASGEDPWGPGDVWHV